MGGIATNHLGSVVELVKQRKGREFISQHLGISMWKARQYMAQAQIVIHGSGAEVANPLSHHNLLRLLKQPKTITELAVELSTDSAAIEEAIDGLESAGYPVSRNDDLIELGRSEEQVKLEARVIKIQSEQSGLKRKYQSLLQQLNEKDRQLVVLSELGGVIATADPAKFVVEADRHRSASVACMVGSDWHYEETIEGAKVNGLNEYNIQIAERRIEKFFQNGLKLIEMSRSKTDIDTLILALIGDLITGYIHEELMEGNACSPTEAVLRVYELVCSGIDFLVENGGFKRIIVPCSYGNHGRTTEKPRISTGAENSYEWLLYQFLMRRYATSEMVSFKVAVGYFTYLDVFGRVIRFHHGDSVKYTGGVGGVHVPLNKAIAQWNKAKPAYLDVLGHWHSRHSSTNYVLNGSTIGYGPYSIRIKADYEPPCQSFFLLHPTRGKTVEAPIYVE